jgi:PAS domain S-box-containing protein
MSAPLLALIAPMAITSALILAMSFGGAWFARRRILNSLNSLKMTAIAYGKGEMTAWPEDPLRETNEVSQALKNSALQLLTRTHELRDSNKTLEERTTELEARTHELKEAQHITKTGHWKWDAIRRTHVASDELHRLYGPKIRLPFAEQRGTVFPEAAWQELKAALQSKKGFSLQLPTLTEYGTQIWTRLIGEVDCNAAGEVTSVHGTLQDVDVYVKADIALQEIAKRYNTLFDEFPEAIVVHINAEIAFVNKAATQLFAAATEQDLVGKTVREFLHPDSHQAFAARFSSITLSGEPTPSIEMKFITTKGATFIGQARSIPLLLDEKRYIQTYIRDLTAQKRQEAETAKLRDEMDNLLVWQAAQNTIAALAHEVNQPLASASLLSEVAMRLLVTDGLSEEAKAGKKKRLEQVLENIGSDIVQAGISQRNLLERLRKPDITKASAMVNAMVTESIQITFLSGVFDYQIVTHYADDLPAVEVNKLQVVKVLRNLIQNAAQATNEAKMIDGKIWISTALTADGREVCVSVRDEGPGISAALGDEVFQPFITTKPHGLGMGLTISRALIEANGGKLWHSQEDGAGATFHFTLPTIS